jgi:hypothetical protein
MGNVHARSRALVGGEEDICAICLEPIQSTDAILACHTDARHPYHTACIDPWLKQDHHNHNICPQDRLPCLNEEAYCEKYPRLEAAPTERWLQPNQACTETNWNQTHPNAARSGWRWQQQRCTSCPTFQWFLTNKSIDDDTHPGRPMWERYGDSVRCRSCMLQYLYD